MSALDNFVTYLAQAHECPIAKSIGPGFSAAFDGARSSRWLAVARLSGDGTGLDSAHIDALSAAMELAVVGLLIVERQAGFAATLADVHGALRGVGSSAAFFGAADHALVAVIHGARSRMAPLTAAPDDFRVLAVVPAYNEEDIIAQTVRDLTRQGIHVHLLDNWSTDATIDAAASACAPEQLTIERFPAGAPSQTYDLASIMARVEEIGLEQPWARWVVLHDADERRRSPWPGVSLRDALWHVDQSGFTCIDHVTMNFWPVDSGFDPQGPDVEQQMPYFEFSAHPGHFHQRRAWKQMNTRVSLAPTAGHDCVFEGRRVYPYKFLLKHYPIRSQQHGERKIMRERLARWNAEERARGWHRQYDEIARQSFLRDPATLTRFDPRLFYEDYLMQRLSGAGVFDTPPFWATPPKW